MRTYTDRLLMNSFRTENLSVRIHAYDTIVIYNILLDS